MKLNRRRFLQTAGAAAALSLRPTAVKAANPPKVVVIGGGFAGATAAKYLRIWSDNTIDVTLVDPNASHVSCVLSNLVLNRRITLQELSLSYGSLRSFYGVKLIQDHAVEIDGTGKQVRLGEGDWLGYDHLVIATGIDFDVEQFEGLDFDRTPHAWIGGPQTSLLARQVGSMSAGSTFVMTIPESPYRCPPGPYERACLVADILKRLGGGRVLVLDANPHIQAERPTFERAFNGIYSDIVEYIPGAPLQVVDSAAKQVTAGGRDYSGDVINVIAPQQARTFVRDSGLTGSGRWAGVDPLTYASTEPGFEGVHIIGDSQGSNQPKSAHMANSQAKICADAIIRSLAGVPNDDPERVANITTNSACYSPITYDEASWLTANFAYDAGSGMMRLTHIGEAERWDSENYEEMLTWASNLFTDSFH